MDNSQGPATIGWWTNYSTGEHLVSIKNPWGIVIIALVGIWLSWSTKYVKKIVGNIALWIYLELLEQPQSSDSREEPTERSSLLSHDSHDGDPAREDAQSLAKIFKEKSGVRDLFTLSLVDEDLKPGDKIRLGIFTLCVALASAGIIVGGYFLAKIRIDGPNLLASDTCGLWWFVGEKRSEAGTRARILDLEKEERAAQFAEDCYGPYGSITSRCNVFYKPKLPVSNPIYSYDCPFKDDICRQNLTVTFTTPTIDAKDLGINSPSTPKFRRANVCTPLSMAYPFIQNQTENGTTTYTYHYGSKMEDGVHYNYTYKTVGDPWDRNAPVYDVFAYSSNADASDHPVWVPHPYLGIPEFSTVTIVFVSSLRILYSEQRSDDPIFPADQPWYVAGDPRPWFRNSDPKARPFACINTIEVCAADEKTCWNFNDSTGNGTISDDTPEFILLYSALYRTDIYYSLAKRQGRALLAQKKVSQYFSTRLGPDPWVAEVQNLVWTALARISINAWSVASGEDSIHEGKDGFVEQTKGLGDLCGKYKYNPHGYQSIRWKPLLTLILFVPIIWFLSWDWKIVGQPSNKAWNSLKKFGNDVLLKVRAQGASSRQGHNSTAAVSSTPGTNNHQVETPATPRQRAGEGEPTPSRTNVDNPLEASGEREPTTSSEAAVSVANIASPTSPAPSPQGSSGRGAATTSGSEASMTPIAQQQGTQQQVTTGTTAQSSQPADTNASDGGKIEWEPLVWTKLLYFILWFMFNIVYYILWKPVTFGWRYCYTRN